MSGPELGILSYKNPPVFLLLFCKAFLVEIIHLSRLDFVGIPFPYTWDAPGLRVIWARPKA